MNADESSERHKLFVTKLGRAWGHGGVTVPSSRLHVPRASRAPLHQWAVPGTVEQLGVRALNWSVWLPGEVGAQAAELLQLRGSDGGFVLWKAAGATAAPRPPPPPSAA